jgi:hypothetical protein
LLAEIRKGEQHMSRQFGFLAAAAVIIAGSGTTDALAQRGNNQKSIIFPTFIPGVPAIRITPITTNNLFNNNNRLPQNVRNRNNNRNGNNIRQTPAEAVLENLRVAQADLDRKNTVNAMLQLQGADNILTAMTKNQAGNRGNNVNDSLKNVRSAKASLSANKLQDADNAIGQAMKELRGNNNNNQRNRKNN